MVKYSYAVISFYIRRLFLHCWPEGKEKKSLWLFQRVIKKLEKVCYILRGVTF